MDWNTKTRKSGRMKKPIEDIFKEMSAPLTEYDKLPKCIAKPS